VLSNVRWFPPPHRYDRIPAAHHDRPEQAKIHPARKLHPPIGVTLCERFKLCYFRAT
jgi:hypothetical protein